MKIKRIRYILIFVGIVFFLVFVLMISKGFFSKGDFEGGVVSLRNEDHTFFETKLIAHAGGGIDGLTYTNSLEALESNYEKGFRYFELDFEWTSDGELVAIHNWENSVRNLFGSSPKIYSYEEFKEAEMVGNLTQLTFEDVANWIHLNPDAFVITDIKTGNLDALEYISTNYPEIIPNLIPQICSFEEYEPTKIFGYENVILTLYRKWYSDSQIVKFAKNNELFGVTMHYSRGLTDLPSKLNGEGVYVMAHTINDKEILNELMKNNINGLYTDFLTFEDIIQSQ